MDSPKREQRVRQKGNEGRVNKRKVVHVYNEIMTNLMLIPIRPFTSEFPQADIHELIAPDILRQVIKGTFKDHLVMWVEVYLKKVHGKTHVNVILDDIDCQQVSSSMVNGLLAHTTHPLISITLAPSFPGLHRFPQGCSFKQWTGNDLKALMKVTTTCVQS